MLVDLTVPGARNGLVLPKIAQACANLCQIAGAENSCLVVHAPTRPKEESDVVPEKDEMDFMELLKKQKMSIPVRWVQPLEVPAAESLDNTLVNIPCPWELVPKSIDAYSIDFSVVLLSVSHQ